MVTTLEPQQANRNPTSGYVAVKVEMLRRLKRAPVDLFVQNDRRGEPVLYLRAGHPFAIEHLTSLIDVGVREIFVRSGEFQEFGKGLLESVQLLVTSETVPYAERFAAPSDRPGNGNRACGPHDRLGPVREPSPQSR